MIDHDKLSHLTPRERGLAIALDLQRRADPKTWRASVDAIEDPEARQVADDYLRGIVIRTKAYIAANGRGDAKKN